MPLPTSSSALFVPGSSLIPAGPAPVPLPYPSMANAIPMGPSMTHLRVLDTQRQVGLSPEGAREAAAGKPLTSLGDQTRAIHSPVTFNNASRIPYHSGDQAGVNSGAYYSGLSPMQSKVIIPN
jgi:hypothetical protein